MCLRVNFFTVIGAVAVLVLTTGLFSCQQAEESYYTDKPFYVQSSDAFKISILPTTEEEVSYRIFDETTTIMHGFDSTRQEMYFDFNLSKGIDNYVLQTSDIQLQIINSDGTSYEFDNNNKELAPLLKDLQSFTDHSLEIYTNEGGGVDYFVDRNYVTNEERKLKFLENNPKDFFLAAVLPFFEFLPQQAVKVGQTWKNKREIRFMGYSFIKNSSYTLLSIDEDGIAKVLEHSTLSTDPTDLQSYQEFNMIIRLKGETEGYFIVDLNQSILLSANSNLNMEGQIETASESIPIKIRGKGRVINKN